MYDELIPLEWVDITASNGQYRFTTQSWADGGYHMFLPVGMFDLTASEPGYVSYSLSITVSDGASLNGINFYLEQSHVPIPEFPINMVSLLMIATLVGALLVKRAVKRLPTAETA